MNVNFTGSLLENQAASGISLSVFMMCLFSALALGCVLAFMYRIKSRSSKSFLSTLAILPAVVCVVILLVNGNLGAGVAVAGSFSLVRFRSAPGTAREICALFVAMAVGLICGMGYLLVALLFTIVMGCVLVISHLITLQKGSSHDPFRTLVITIPEDLDYTGVFDDIFELYTTRADLVSVRTTQLGSLFRLNYELVLKDPKLEKEMIDELRCRNGNLEILLSRQATVGPEL